MNLLLLVLVPACFALNPVIGRALVAQFGPATLSLIRWALSAALAIALLAVWRAAAERWQAPAALIVRIGLLGILGMGFCSYAAFEAARTTQAPTSAWSTAAPVPSSPPGRSPPGASGPPLCWASASPPACLAWC
jgi:drug/metabolite transporter (DMT)-like permease